MNILYGHLLKKWEELVNFLSLIVVINGGSYQRIRLGNLACCEDTRTGQRDRAVLLGTFYKLIAKGQRGKYETCAQAPYELFADEFARCLETKSPKRSRKWKNPYDDFFLERTTKSLLSI